MQGCRLVPFSAWLCECDIKNSCRCMALVPHFGSTILYSARGRKARREGGGSIFPARRAACLAGVIRYPSRRGYNTPISREHEVYSSHYYRRFIAAHAAMNVWRRKHYINPSISPVSVSIGEEKTKIPALSATCAVKARPL